MSEGHEASWKNPATEDRRVLFFSDERGAQRGTSAKQADIVVSAPFALRIDGIRRGICLCKKTVTFLASISYKDYFK